MRKLKGKILAALLVVMLLVLPVFGNSFVSSDDAYMAPAGQTIDVGAKLLTESDLTGEADANKKTAINALSQYITDLGSTNHTEENWSKINVELRNKHLAAINKSDGTAANLVAIYNAAVTEMNAVAKKTTTNPPATDVEEYRDGRISNLISEKVRYNLRDEWVISTYPEGSTQYNGLTVKEIFDKISDPTVFTTVEQIKAFHDVTLAAFHAHGTKMVTDFINAVDELTEYLTAKGVISDTDTEVTAEELDGLMAVEFTAVTLYDKAVAAYTILSDYSRADMNVIPRKKILDGYAKTFDPWKKAVTDVVNALSGFNSNDYAKLTARNADEVGSKLATIKAQYEALMPGQKKYADTKYFGESIEKMEQKIADAASANNILIGMDKYVDLTDKANPKYKHPKFEDKADILKIWKAYTDALQGVKDFVEEDATFPVFKRVYEASLKSFRVVAKFQFADGTPITGDALKEIVDGRGGCCITTYLLGGSFSNSSVVNTDTENGREYINFNTESKIKLAVNVPEGYVINAVKFGSEEEIKLETAGKEYVIAEDWASSTRWNQELTTAHEILVTVSYAKYDFAVVYPFKDVEGKLTFDATGKPVNEKVAYKDVIAAPEGKDAHFTTIAGVEVGGTYGKVIEANGVKYVFVGMYTDPTFTFESKYEYGKTLDGKMPNADLTLYARYVEIKTNWGPTQTTQDLDIPELGVVNSNIVDGKYGFIWENIVDWENILKDYKWEEKDNVVAQYMKLLNLPYVSHENSAHIYKNAKYVSVGTFKAATTEMTAYGTSEERSAFKGFKIPFVTRNEDGSLTFNEFKNDPQYMFFYDKDGEIIAAFYIEVSLTKYEEFTVTVNNEYGKYGTDGAQTSVEFKVVSGGKMTESNQLPKDFVWAIKDSETVEGVTYKFGGWEYTIGEGKDAKNYTALTLNDFEGLVINGDLTITAKWIAETALPYSEDIKLDSNPQGVLAHRAGENGIELYFKDAILLDSFDETGYNIIEDTLYLEVVFTVADNKVTSVKNVEGDLQPEFVTTDDKGTTITGLIPVMKKVEGKWTVLGEQKANYTWEVYATVNGTENVLVNSYSVDLYSVKYETVNVTLVFEEELSHVFHILKGATLDQEKASVKAFAKDNKAAAEFIGCDKGHFAEGFGYFMGWYLIDGEKKEEYNLKTVTFDKDVTLTIDIIPAEELPVDILDAKINLEGFATGDFVVGDGANGLETGKSGFVFRLPAAEYWDLEEVKKGVTITLTIKAPKEILGYQLFGKSGKLSLVTEDITLIETATKDFAIISYDAEAGTFTININADRFLTDGKDAFSDYSLILFDNVENPHVKFAYVFSIKFVDNYAHEKLTGFNTKYDEYVAGGEGAPTNEEIQKLLDELKPHVDNFEELMDEEAVKVFRANEKEFYFENSAGKIDEIVDEVLSEREYSAVNMAAIYTLKLMANDELAKANEDAKVTADDLKAIVDKYEALIREVPTLNDELYKDVARDHAYYLDQLAKRAAFWKANSALTEEDIAAIDAAIETYETGAAAVLAGIYKDEESEKPADAAVKALYDTAYEAIEKIAADAIKEAEEAAAAEAAKALADAKAAAKAKLVAPANYPAAEFTALIAEYTAAIDAATSIEVVNICMTQFSRDVKVITDRIDAERAAAEALAAAKTAAKAGLTVPTEYQKEAAQFTAIIEEYRGKIDDATSINDVNALVAEAKAAIAAKCAEIDAAKEEEANKTEFDKVVQDAISDDKIDDLIDSVLKDILIDVNVMLERAPSLALSADEITAKVNKIIAAAKEKGYSEAAANNIGAALRVYIEYVNGLEYSADFELKIKDAELEFRNTVNTITDRELQARLDAAKQELIAKLEAEKAELQAKLEAEKAELEAKLEAEKAKREEAEKAAAEKAAADKTAADAVIKLINELGEEPTEEALKAARDAYNALTADQKALVENESDLTKAEIKAGIKDNSPLLWIALALLVILIVIAVLTLIKVKRKGGNDEDNNDNNDEKKDDDNNEPEMVEDEKKN